MSDTRKRVTLGLVEKVRFRGKKRSMDVLARIDTGATNSAIDSGLVIEIGLGPFRTTKVIKSTHGNSVRPLIEAQLELHDVNMTANFTVAERAHMRYKVLIGQNILTKGRFLIDPCMPNPYARKRNVRQG